MKKLDVGVKVDGTDKSILSSRSHTGVQEEGQAFVLLLHRQNVNPAKSATGTPYASHPCPSPFAFPSLPIDHICLEA